LIFTLPIYYTQTFKTKPDKTMLVGMNQFNTAHYYLKNNIKQTLQDSLESQFADIGPILGPYQVHYSIYYKNSSCDGSNIAALMEKIFLDAAQKFNITREDNVQYHLGSTWSIAGQDKLNPRCEIQITQPESV
jgi:hypothetical protein